MSVMAFENKAPEIGARVFLAPGVLELGEVFLGADLEIGDDS